MAECVQTEPAQLQVILERVDPVRNVARYYILSVEPTLFAHDTLIRRWGRIGWRADSACSFSTAKAPRGLRSKPGSTASAGAATRSNEDPFARACSIRGSGAKIRSRAYFAAA